MSAAREAIERRRGERKRQLAVLLSGAVAGVILDDWNRAKGCANSLPFVLQGIIDDTITLEAMGEAES